MQVVPDEDSTSMRRGRPTIRCLTEDLGLELPGSDIDLGDLAGPWMDELRRIAPHSPQGQKRILSIGSPMVFRLRVSNERGATWVDDERHVVWLCAVHRREQDSDDDAYAQIVELHGHGELLPTEDDRLRDDVDGVLRFHRLLTEDLLDLVDQAIGSTGKEITADLADWLPCRALVLDDDGLQEIWCALGVRGTDETFVAENQRDLLFAELEHYLAPIEMEARSDWPSGDVRWWEAVR